MSRTDQEIVDQTNELATVILADIVGTGYEVAPGYKLYEHLDNPRIAKAWSAACQAQILLTSTDPNDALSALDVTRKFVVVVEETVRYTLHVEAVDEECAKDAAHALWEHSEDPGQYGAQGFGIEIYSVQTLEEYQNGES